MVSFKALFGDDAPILREQNFQLLLLANLMPPLGTALLSPTLDTLIDSFNASPANIGLLLSAFSAPAIVIIPIAGILADRYGRKPVLVVGLVFFGTGGTAIVFTTDFRIAIAFRLLQGVGFACLTPIIVTSIGDLFEGASEATAQGLRFTGSGLSQTIFPLISGILVMVAWQYPFLLYALAFPIAVLIYIGLEEPANSNEPDSETVSDRRPTDLHLRLLYGVVTQRRVQAMVIGRCLPNAVWIGFLTYNSIIVIRILGGTPTQAGILAATGSLAYAVSASQTGRITAWFDSRFLPLVGANIALGSGFIFMIVSSSISVAAVGVVVFGFGFGILLPLYRSIITDLAPTELRGSLVSLAEAGGRVSSTLAPIIMGIIVAVGAPILGFIPAIQTAGLAVATVACGGGILCLLVANNAPPVDHSR